jgi:hypothetical protein
MIKLLGGFHLFVSLILLQLTNLNRNNLYVNGFSYPSIVSGTASFNYAVAPQYYDRTYAYPFPSGLTVMCAYAISGFSFEPPNSTYVIMDFFTSVTICTNHLLQIQSVIRNSTQVDMKLSYLVIANS